MNDRFPLNGHPLDARTASPAGGYGSIHWLLAGDLGAMRVAFGAGDAASGARTEAEPKTNARVARLRDALSAADTQRIAIVIDDPSSGVRANSRPCHGRSRPRSASTRRP